MMGIFHGYLWTIFSSKCGRAIGHDGGPKRGPGNSKMGLQRKFMRIQLQARSGYEIG
jgi:hypothetical protein